MLRFRPTDEELFAHYLVGKATGAPLPPGLIEERDVYGQEPWNIFDVTSDETFYIFTTLRKNKSRVLRTAGTGTWKEQHTTKIKDSRGELVGHKKTFKFKEGRGSNAPNGRWIMYEYSMCDDKQCKHVLCKIKYYNDEKKSEKKAIVISCDKLVPFEDDNRPMKRARIQDDSLPVATEQADDDGWMDRLINMDSMVYSDLLSSWETILNPSEDDTNAMLAGGGPYNQRGDTTSLRQQTSVAESKDEDEPTALTWADKFLLL